MSLCFVILPAVVEQHREKYGLVQASELAAKSARMKEEAERMRLTAHGRGEETTYRNKEGKLVTKEEYVAERGK